MKKPMPPVSGHVTVFLDVHTVSEANRRGEHWTKKYKRDVHHRESAARAVVEALGGDVQDIAAAFMRKSYTKNKPPVAYRHMFDRQARLGEMIFPCAVTLTRVVVGDRQLLDDGDNLSISCKRVRDGVADALGVDDNDPRVSWECKQVGGAKKEGVIVQIVRTSPSLLAYLALEKAVKILDNAHDAVFAEHVRGVMDKMRPTLSTENRSWLDSREDPK